MEKIYEIFSGKDLEVAELILRRRMQMMVHSYLYYDMDTNLISDRQFDTWGRELVQLQADYPEISKRVEYAEAFSDWDASTGFNLPRNEQVVRIGQRLLRINHTSGETKAKIITQPKPKEVAKPKKKTTARKSLF